LLKDEVAIDMGSVPEPKQKHHHVFLHIYCNV